MLGLLVAATAGGGFGATCARASASGSSAKLHDLLDVAVEAVLEVEAGEGATAVVYVLVSVVGGLAAATAGYALGAPVS